MHDLVRDEQADAEPAVVARGGVYGAEVALKEAGLFLGGNSDARILHGHARVRPGVLHGNRDPSALRRVLDGVRYQVDQHLLEPLAVPFDDDRDTGAAKEDVVVARLRTEIGHHVVRQLVHLHVRGAELHAARLQPRDVEQVLHQLPQPLHLPPRLAHQFAADGLAALQPPLDAVQIHGKRRERRPQLVRGDR